MYADNYYHYMESIAQIFSWKYNTMCLEQTFLISRMQMSTTHILLSTAVIQQIRCREYLVPEH